MRFDITVGIDEPCDTCSRPAFASDLHQGWKDCCTACRLSQGKEHTQDCGIRMREVASHFAAKLGVKL